jgi:hypothetical protein
MTSLKKMVLVVAILSFGVSCIKEEDVNEGIQNNEKTLIKLPQAAEELWNIALDDAPGFTELAVLEVRRDAISSAELQQTITAKIAHNDGAISAYNATNPPADPDLLKFRIDSLLVTTEGVKFEGGNYLVPFGPGEFVKFIKIKMETSKLDLSKRNATAFKVVDGGGAAVSVSSEALVEIAVKNKYDGVYKMEGTLVDYTAPTITALSPVEVALITTGSKTVKMYDYYWPGDYHPILSGTARSVYGTFSPLFKFDENDNVIEVGNAYGTPSSTRLGQLDPSGVNKYDEATKTLTVKYRMLQSSVVTAPPHIRTLFDEVLTYVGPR